MILIASGIIVVLLIIQDTLIVGALYAIRHSRTTVDSTKHFPHVSVFVPCRNEEIHLPECLRSLEALDYPDDKISFYLGDDNSVDETWTIMSAWAVKRENRHTFRFQSPQKANMNGKAVALHRMVEQSSADFYLFTDADCQVPSTWAKEMIASYEAANGMVTGITKVEADDWFGKMQACDWWLSLAMIKVMTDRGINLTAMGNNLLVERSAYHHVGGFAAVADSVTEDLALSRKVAAAGFYPASRVNARLLVTTKAEHSYAALLRQRKRWARGALTLPFLWKLLLFLQVAFYPAILCVMVYNPWIGTAAWTLKILIQSQIISLFSRLTETKIRRFLLFSFECYHAVVGCSTVLYYFWPSAIRWKGREYR